MGMYIWEDYQPDKKYSVALTADEIFSPFIENFQLGYEKERYVNPLIRFGDIFRPLFAEQAFQSIAKSDRKELENILFHYLAQLDRKCGISYPAICYYLLDRKIMAGGYGAKIKELYAALQEKEQLTIQFYLYKYNQHKRRKYYYKEAVEALFPGSRLYFYQDEGKFLVYLPYAQSAYKQKLMQLVELLFMDLTVEVRLFWQYHFGIIGNQKTMILDEIEIY